MPLPELLLWARGFSGRDSKSFDHSIAHWMFKADRLASELASKLRPNLLKTCPWLDDELARRAELWVTIGHIALEESVRPLTSYEALFKTLLFTYINLEVGRRPTDDFWRANDPPRQSN